MNTPTEQAYTELQRAYDFFNDALFDAQLPPCLMTMQRKNRTYGYFSSGRWASHDGKAVTDEIAMNPVHFSGRSVNDVLSTLAHEMVHLWQHHYGKPSQAAYHNRQWADKMEAIGLEPSDTGCPGGKRTGQHMSHYIRDGGPFCRTCAKLLAQGFTISWKDRAREDNTGKNTKSGTREKYTCPSCRLNAWAKADAHLMCGGCVMQMVSDTPGVPNHSTPSTTVDQSSNALELAT